MHFGRADATVCGGPLSQSHGGKTFPRADPEIQEELKRSCVKHGANIWTNTTQKEQATRDAIELLDKAIGR